MSERAYLVRCGLCSYIGGPDLGHCAKCGYDGGFAEGEPQNQGGEWIELAPLVALRDELRGLTKRFPPTPLQVDSLADRTDRANGVYETRKTLLDQLDALIAADKGEAGA